MPPKKSNRTKEELLRIWQKIDKNNDGTISVEDIVQQGKTIETECPEFILNFETLAKSGKVTRQSFLDFYLKKGPRIGSSSDAVVDREVDLMELRKVFDDIVSASGSSELRLKDLLEHKTRIKAIFPDLLTNFTAADLDGSSTLSWDELKIFASGTDEWLEFQFDRIIGLHRLKEQLRQFHRSVTLDIKRRASGHDIKTGGKYHMIFQGNPGTGKTTIARLVAQMLNKIEIIESDLLVEVQRDKLVAEYVGQTGPKTQKVIDESKSGVLFIDEAYRLSQGGGKNDFGREAIEQLMGAMNEPPGKAPVMVLAGYPDDMDTFMQANSGLYRRIAYTFDFENYSPVELGHILDLTAQSAGFCLAPELVENKYEKLGEMIEANTLERARAMMNGGICERIFTFAKQALDAREVQNATSGTPSVELTADDILEACQRIPPPPSRDADPVVPTSSDSGGGADVSRLHAEIDRLQEKLRMASTGDAAALGKAEGRASAAEAETARLLEEVKRLRETSIGDCTGRAQAESRAAAIEAEVERLRNACSGDAGALAAAEGRAAGAEALVGTLKAQVSDLQASSGGDVVALKQAQDRALVAEADVKRLQMELDQHMSGISSHPATIAALEAEIAKLRAQVDPNAPTCASVQAAPTEYEFLPCIYYSAGCCCFFTVMFLSCVWKYTKIISRWIWKWTCIFIAWLQATISGDKGQKVTPELVSVNPTAAPAAAKAEP